MLTEKKTEKKITKNKTKYKKATRPGTKIDIKHTHFLSPSNDDYLQKVHLSFFLTPTDINNLNLDKDIKTENSTRESCSG